MPTISVQRDALFRLLEKEYTDEDFGEVCFEFGLELDEVVKEWVKDEHGEEKETIMYKIEIPANRYDLLCLEGLGRALRVFLGKEKPPIFSTHQGKEKLFVHEKTEEVRPFIVAAILKNVTLTQLAYDSFIDLQDKLHQNIGRRRTLVAIGTHDYDTIQGPFTYEALLPKEIHFIPLNQSKVMNGEELMEFYKSDMKLKKYLPIIIDKPRYPVIFDKNRVVCSLPPIINGDHSKIRVTTKNIFVECTAIDLTKAQITLNTIVTMFSQYCHDPFTVETVEVIYANGKRMVCPDLNDREMEVDVNYITRRVGVPLTAEQTISLLEKMYLPCKKIAEQRLLVRFPPTRSDILHPCDIVEDVSIAYGFNRIPVRVPGTNTIARSFPLNKLSDMLRTEMAQAGYSEALTLSLCSYQENFEFLKRKDKGNEAALLANPKTLEYQVVRTSLLPGLLKTISCNKKMPLPIKMFEVSDVVLKDASKDVGARNERHLCVIYYASISGFELVHGVLDRIMQILGINAVHTNESGGYFIKPSEEPTFFPDRQAEIYYNLKKIGAFGILHPDVIRNFDLNNPCSSLEINIEPFL